MAWLKVSSGSALSNYSGINSKRYLVGYDTIGVSADGPISIAISEPLSFRLIPVIRDLPDEITITMAGRLLSASEYTYDATTGQCAVPITNGNIHVNAVGRYKQTPLIVFTSPYDFVLGTTYNVKSWNGTIEYSFNGVSWNYWTGANLSVKAGRELFLRGHDNYIVNNYSQGWNAFTLDGRDIQCTGDLATLLDSETVLGGSSPNMGDYAFTHAFYYCRNLITAPDLPKARLNRYCCENIFEGCVNLLESPRLPATTLENGCYLGAFSYCSKIRRMPELPAGSVSRYAYSNMFAHCENLEELRPLAATTVQDNAYNAMFSGCLNLSRIVNLPAKTLRDACYAYMFSSCSKIKMSRSEDAEYKYPFRIPQEGRYSTYSGYPLTGMFADTGGAFTGTPYAETTYYTTNPPI